MTDFVLGTLSVLDNHNPLGLNEARISRYISITNYAKFLKQPLTLGMFIPCDEDGKPLNEPKSSLIYKIQVGECSADEMRQNREYNQAKQRVLFESYQLIYRFQKWKSTLIAKNKDGLGQFDIYDYKTIEDLIPLNLTLTSNAIKQIGL